MHLNAQIVAGEIFVAWYSGPWQVSYCAGPRTELLSGIKPAASTVESNVSEEISEKEGPKLSVS